MSTGQMELDSLRVSASQVTAFGVTGGGVSLKCSLGMRMGWMKALTRCLTRRGCATQPSPPRDTGEVLAICTSTSYPEGCRAVAHISRHRVQIKVTQHLPVLVYFERAV